MDTPRSIAVDPVKNLVLVGGRSTLSFGWQQVPPLLYVFRGDGVAPIVELSYPEQFMHSQAVGLAVAGAPSHRVHALASPSPDAYYGQFGTTGVQIFEPTAIPAADVLAPTQVTPTGAHLSGVVDPGGVQASAHFEYSTDGGGTWPGSTPDQDVGTTAGSIEDDVSGLEPNTAYTVRLVVTNAAKTGTSDNQTFTTDVSPPYAATGAATDLSDSGAVLNGRINPYGLVTTYYFEYGESTGYGQRVPVNIGGAAGTGRVRRLFSRNIAGLTSGTTYHFRVVAQSDAGVTTGGDATFTTPQAAETRSYEQVSPVEKHGATFDKNSSFMARTGGDGIVFKAVGPPSGDDTEGAPFFFRYAGVRGADGWTTRTFEGPNSATNDYAMFSSVAVSGDLTKALIVSNQALAPGGVADVGNYYIRDTRTLDYTFVASSSDSGAFISMTGLGNGARRFIAGADDFSWIVFSADYPLTPDATAGVENIYRWSVEDGLELVSVRPDGTPMVGVSTARLMQMPQIRSVSDDGSRIVFAEDGVYVRENGETTTALSVSQAVGGSSVPQPGKVGGISRDGRYVVFLTYTNDPLTDDAPGGPGGIYRYDFTTGELEYLASATLNFLQGVSDDASHVYFSSQIYDYAVWHDGTVTDFATFEFPDIPLFFALSPHGRYFAFTSNSPVPSYEDAPPGQMYLYDAQTDQVSCASCPKDGSAAAGPARMPTRELLDSNRYQRVVTDQGEVFFDTVSKLVARDVNGMRDAYVYRDGAPQLLSPGNGPFDAYFADASDDARDVFIATSQSLVGQDTDTANDIYDARVGGGFASQNPPPGPADCAAESCAGAGAGAPAEPSNGGSEGYVGPGNESRSVRGISAKLISRNASGSAFTLAIKTSGRGRIAASGAGVRTARRTASRAGTYRVHVLLTASARKALRRKHKLEVRVRVKYTSSLGVASTTTVSATLRHR